MQTYGEFWYKVISKELLLVQKMFYARQTVIFSIFDRFS